MLINGKELYFNPAPTDYGMQNPETAASILARGGDPESVSICDFCIHHGETSCPFRGKTVKGPCKAYVLENSDPAMVETRVTSLLTGSSN